MRSGTTSGELKAMNFQVLPPLSAEDYAALKSDIAARGVLVPVEYDEEGNILDGHHRVQICGELGIKTWPKFIRKGLTDTEKKTHARQLNLARRHLDQAARRTLIEEELRENPERSNRQIAASLGVSHPTVADVREQMESTGKIYQLEKTVGADGKERPAHKPIRTRFVDDMTSANAKRSNKRRRSAQRKSKSARRRRAPLMRNARLKAERLPTFTRSPRLVKGSVSSMPTRHGRSRSIASRVRNVRPSGTTTRSR